MTSYCRSLSNKFKFVFSVDGKAKESPFSKWFMFSNDILLVRELPNICVYKYWTHRV